MEMFDLFYRPLVGWGVRHRGLTIDEADDIAQSIFIFIWTHRAEWPVTSGTFRYLLRAMHNRSKNERRDRERRLARQGAATAADEPSILNDAEHAIDEAELTADITAIVGSLPQRERDVLRMRKWEGRSMKAIEHALGLSENTVRATLVRAIARLHAALTERGWGDILLRIRHNRGLRSRRGAQRREAADPVATLGTADETCRGEGNARRS